MKARLKAYAAWLLIGAAPLGCNVILGNEEVHLKDDDDTLDGSPNNGKLDARSPDTSVGSDGSGGSTSADGSFVDNRTTTDGNRPDGAGGSVPQPDAPLPEGGTGTPDRDGGPNPPPDGTTPVPDGTTPIPDVSTDRTTPPTGTDGGVDSTIPPPPPGDGGPTCTSPQIECGGKCVSPTDPKTCGSCTHDCTNLPHVSGTTTCQAGACVVPPGSCASGYAHCSTNVDDGCEVDISKPEHCGACATVCTTAAPLCAQNAADGGASSFQCKSQCAAPSPDLCGMSCTSKATDKLNCGTCGNTCPAPKTHGQASCAASACGYMCNANYSVCLDDCVDLQNDALNCKTCGAVCSAPAAHGKAVCTNATCAFGCESGYPDTCNGTCVNFKTDTANCGSCGGACTAPANGTVTGCSNGACQTACNDGYDKVGTACSQVRFYIATSGNDSAAGTPSAPFKTWKRAATSASLVTSPKIYFNTGIYSSTASGEDYATKIPEGATVATVGGKVTLQGNGVVGLPFAGSGTVNGGTTVDGLILTGFSEPFSATLGTQTLTNITLKEMQTPLFASGTSMSITGFVMESIAAVGQFRVWSGTLSLTNGSINSVVPNCLSSSPGRSTTENDGILVTNNVTSNGGVSLTSRNSATLTGSTFGSTCASQNMALDSNGPTTITINNSTMNYSVRFTSSTVKSRGTTFNGAVAVSGPDTYDFGKSGSAGGNTFISGLNLNGENVTVSAAGNNWIANEPPAGANGTVNASTTPSLTGPYSSGNIYIEAATSTVTF